MSYKYQRVKKKKKLVVITFTLPEETVSIIDGLIDGVEIANRCQAVRHLLAKAIKEETK